MKVVLLLVLIFILTSNSYPQSSRSSQSKQEESSSGVNIWGLVYGDYFYKAGGDSTNNNLEYSKYPKEFNAFAFRRVNFGFDYSISENFDTRISVSYDGPDTLPDGNRGIYVRDAYINWKEIFTNSNLTFGIFPTPGYDYISQKWWGYRSIEQTIMGQRGILGSRDMGIMLSGNFDQTKNYGYYAMIGNGTGGRIENNKYKKFYGLLFGYFLDKKLVVDLYSDYANSGNNQSKTTLSGFIGYKNDDITLGLENVFQIQNNFNTSINRQSPDITPYGMSFFFAQNIVANNLKYFVRYDFYNQDINNSSTGFYQSFATAGLDIMPVPNVHIMPNIWLNAFTPKENQRVKYTTDVVPRLTLWYVYN